MSLNDLTIRCFGLPSASFCCHLLLISRSLELYNSLKTKWGGCGKVQAFRKDQKIFDAQWGMCTKGASSQSNYQELTWWLMSWTRWRCDWKSRFSLSHWHVHICLQIWLEDTACRLCRMSDEVLADWERGESAPAIWTGKEAPGELVGWRPVHDAVQ